MFAVARGDLLGPEQPVILHLLDIPMCQEGLGGVVMEIEDCALPLVAGMLELLAGHERGWLVLR